jgi:RNA ligase
MLPFTREELQLAVDEKRVYARRHPTLPLTIYNYSDEVAFGGWWNSVTLTCRGLILDDDFNIVARPWSKFFNMGQRDNEIEFHAPVEVTDKLDGSLGILYPHADYGWAIATRGSFSSDQAIEATAILHEKYKRDFPNFLEDNTYLFEIIYPENRIVVDYKGQRDLVLLGAVNKRYGYYLGPGEAQGELMWNGPVAETFQFKDFADVLANWPHREGKEGIVVRSGNKMVKLKQPDYLELHKLVTNATPLNVWRQLKEGHSGFAIVSNFPDEFHDYIWDMAQPLEKAFETRLAEIMKGYSYMMDTYASYGEGEFNRGRFARLIKNSPDKRYYFMLLDNKSIRTVLWQELRPREEAHEQVEAQGSQTHQS